MADMDLEKLLSAASDKTVAKNAVSITEMLKEAKGMASEIESIVMMLKRTGVLPGVMRAVGKKYAVDVETPLAGDMAVVAPSEAHKLYFEEIAKLTREQLAAVIKVIQNGDKKPETGKP